MLGTERLRSRARKILDEVRMGIEHSLAAINWALRITGDAK